MELAEPIRGAVRSTAGSWDRLIHTSPQTMRSWEFPNNCDLLEVVGAVMWQSILPFTSGPLNGPTPSPALIIEAVRTIANWLPASAPEHVRNAMAYLTEATGSDSAGPTTDSVKSTQSPATRAIRTLRALRAQRDRDLAADQNTATASSTSRAAESTDKESVPLLARRGGSPLLGPGGTLRRRRSAPRRPCAPSRRNRPLRQKTLPPQRLPSLTPTRSSNYSNSNAATGVNWSSSSPRSDCSLPSQPVSGFSPISSRWISGNCGAPNAPWKSGCCSGSTPR